MNGRGEEKVKRDCHLHGDVDQLGRAQLLPRAGSGQPALSSPPSATNVVGETHLPLIRRRKVGGVLPAVFVDASRRVVVDNPIAHLKKQAPMLNRVEQLRVLHFTASFLTANIRLASKNNIRDKGESLI